MTENQQTTAPELAIVGGRVYTGDPTKEWVEAFAVTGGRITARGSSTDIRSLAGDQTEIVDVAGRMVMAGFSDGHIHLGLGGAQAAWEMPLLPDDDMATILTKVRDWSTRLGSDEWVVGGIVGSPVIDVVTTTDLAALDEAAGGRPVLLRDDSMHNRWVNSRALELMDVTADSPDPEGGSYVKDDAGRLTGVLHELASTIAEATHAASIADPVGRAKGSLATALRLVNSFGITSVQDAATMGAAFQALAALESEGAVSAWVVGSMPVRTFIEPGPTGTDLFSVGAAHRSEHVRPDFVKVVLDGVPMTRTTAMLTPYRCHEHEDETFTGESLWTLDDLTAELLACCDRGLNAKLHATGDASVRLVLDAVERVRAERGEEKIFQIAHTEFIHPDDLHRFAELGVVADASPYIWYPGIIQEIIAQQIPEDIVASSWPCKDLLDSGAVLAAGSDWPCALPSPDPWVGLETMVTRRNPDPAVPGELNGSQRLSLEQAIAAFTREPARAMGLGDVTGSLVEGLSADFIVLDQDLFAISPADIHRTKVQQTWFEGRLVYDASAADA